MANRKSKTTSIALGSSYPSRDYQCEEDVRTLQRAAEVMADTGRKRSAMKMFKKQKTGMESLLGMGTRR